MDILRTLNETMQEIRTSLQPRIAVEAMLIGLCRPSEVGGSETVAVGSHSADTARIARLEEEVRRLTARLAAGGTAKAGAAGRGAALAAPAAPTAAVQLEQKSAAPKRIARSENPGAAAAGAPRRLDGALWKKFQVRMKERHKLAASLLSGADYEGATETHFFIRPATDMARDYITKRHRAVFEEVMAEIAGRPLTVVCTGGEDEEASSVPPAAKTPEYPAPVAELLKIAGDGARVEEVTAPAEHRAPKTAPLTPSVEEDAPYEVYEPTADEEAEMFDTDELPPDADT